MRAALPLSPVHPLERAQKLFFLPLAAFVFGFGAGALSFDPVARLYFARPLAVNPAPLEAGNFSPRPTERLGPLLRLAGITSFSSLLASSWQSWHFA